MHSNRFLELGDPHDELPSMTNHQSFANEPVKARRSTQNRPATRHLIIHYVLTRRHWPLASIYLGAYLLNHDQKAGCVEQPKHY
jgi:hypothetical protein